MSSRRMVVVGLVAVLQIAIVLGLAWRHQERLEAGRDVVLRVAPVDPRDVLRGDYVRLGYTIERLTATVPVEPAVSAGQPAWVVLRLHADGRLVETVSVHAALPDALTADQVALRVAWQRTAEATEESHHLSLPSVDRYYLPEGTGPVLEEALRAGTVEVRLRVSADGSALIGAILVNGASPPTD